MEPVVGIDVAKKFSVVQAFTKRNEPFGKPLTLSHEEGGFEQLGELLAELQAKTNMTPVVVLESTGHYHRALVAYLNRSEWPHLWECKKVILLLSDLSHLHFLTNFHIRRNK
ncbi:hypothetical protein PRECH8_28410 [Insulibacter thermoxylanivorax]|uniref:Transposase IS110-like N-terminal domain-containing protein n=2 Tax=Insulibacter thermoxylanivorax TaxID=2749268 RepID=A0A916VIN5_9BACL|nr:hypothetical protein PRECH8_28410 [Insulibacter thermoxylanivorax]